MTGGALTLSGVLVALIAGLLIVRATYVVRRERNQGRGTVPGTGHTTIHADYFSGGSGGGQSRSYTVPRDPQEYARLFVPQTPDKPKDRS